LAIKVGLRYLPPLTFAGVSFATATFWLLLIVKGLHKRLPRDWSSWRVMIFLGLTMMGVGFAFQYWGEQYVSSGLAAVLFATCPLFVLIFAHILIEEEKITRWKAIGLTISFIGLMMIFRRELTPVFSWNTLGSLFGAFAEVGSAATTALAIVVYRRFYAEIDRVVNLLVQTIIGAALLLILGGLWERSSSFDLMPIAIVAIIYLGLATTIPFIGYYWLLERNSAINISTITFITPILAVALGWILLGEHVTGSTVLGGGLILAGVYFTFHATEGHKA
jgi:drug/metabolite transporter (DMT)-like permease